MTHFFHALYPSGLIITVVAGLCIWAVIKLHPQSDDDLFPDERPRRCQVCGSKISIVGSEWMHTDPECLLLVRSMPHTPEPLVGMNR